MKERQESITEKIENEKLKRLQTFNEDHPLISELQEVDRLYERFMSGEIDGDQVCASLSESLLKEGVVRTIATDLKYFDATGSWMGQSHAEAGADFQALIQKVKRIYLQYIGSVDTRKMSLTDYILHAIAVSETNRADIDKLSKRDQDKFWAVVANIEEHL